MLLALTFLLSFGFAGGVLFLMFFMVPLEQWLVDKGTSQSTMDAMLTTLTVGWLLLGLCATILYARLFLLRRRTPAAIGIAGVSLIAALVTFFFLLDTDLMVLAGRTGQENTQNERFTFGPYPDRQKIERLEEQGYDGIISIMNPKIPFEKVLLEEERQNAREVGIPLYSHPMLPWISENRKSLKEIKDLVSQNDKRYYIHCYLGEHRVDLVRRELGAGESPSVEKEPLPEELERGRLLVYGEEEIVLGPYPTEDEWLDVVLRRGVKEVVSTLDPANPEDVPWIQEERRIAKENDLIFTLKPLDPESPDPQDAKAVAQYILSLDHKVYVHDFSSGNRLDILESELWKAKSL